MREDILDDSDQSLTERDSQDPRAMLADGDTTTFAFDIPVHMDAGNPTSDGEGGSTVVAKPLINNSSEVEGWGNGARRQRVPKSQRRSRHGIPYSLLPGGLIKSLAVSLAQSTGDGKAKVDREALSAIVQASDWFFEQVSHDLDAYAQHAERKVINETDVITLMKRCSNFAVLVHCSSLIFSRQRLLTATATPFSLAQKYLPRDLIQIARTTRPNFSLRSNQ